jgi:uncharacterized protein (TIGR02302 family)
VSQHADDGRGLTRRLVLARMALLWEALWPLAWPIPTLAVLFVAVALFDVLPLLPGWLHAGVLVGFVVALGFFVWRLRRLARPGLAQARRRIERDSGFEHRPLQGLVDTLEAGTDDPVARALWWAQRRRLSEVLKRLSVRLPEPSLARADPLGLRFVPLLLLAIALSGTWQDAGPRLLRAVTPSLDGIAGPPAVLQVWITPPAYTGIAPILLQRQPSAERISVPAGSLLLAELQGGDAPAQLGIDDNWQPFKPLDADSQRLETQLTKGEHLGIRQGHRVIGAWDIAVVQDTPPSITFSATPDTDADGRLRLSIDAHDDYGVTKAWAVIRRADTPDAEPLTAPLPLGGAHPSDVHQSSWIDLTGHPWAGLAVTLQPEAEDGAGQQGLGETIKLTLPERKFTHPVARAIVALRRKLAADPGQREETMAGLAGIASDLDSYGGDIQVFLALAGSRARLLYDRTDQAVPGVLDMMWQAALRIEEGDRPAAERALEQASRELEEALANNASEAEIERLTNQLQTAMAQYLDAVAQQMARQGVSPLPASPDQQLVTPGELQAMLDQLRDLARTGSREGAQQMLSELHQMLEGLRSSMQGGPSAQEAQQAQKTAEALQALTRDQSALLDDTFRRNQQAEEPGLEPPPPKAAPSSKGKSSAKPPHAADQQRQKAAGDQEGLRKRLGQMMEDLGEMGIDIPNALGQAEQAMRDASQSLRNDALQDAIDAQGEAVARLQEGARQAMQSLSKRMGGVPVGQGGSPGRDPLGRPLRGSGTADDDSVKIPTQSDTQKAREVLDELRKRSGQAQRPAAEKDYLQRLLKQFY